MLFCFSVTAHAGRAKGCKVEHAKKEIKVKRELGVVSWFADVC